MDAKAGGNGAPLGEPDPVVPPIPVPELRDHRRINAEVVRRLDRGDARVQVEGAAGHRLLLAGLAGGWRATIEILGDAGPELAFGLNAPGIVVVCRGAAGDGAGSRLRAGTLLLLGPAGTAVGYHQEGGLIAAAASVGPRAGLGQRGGDLVLLGSAGPLLGELSRGGRLLSPPGRAGRRLIGAEAVHRAALDLLASLDASDLD